MRVQCDRCGSSYTLPEERIAPGRRLQFQCRHCQNRIVVSVPDPAASPQQAPARHRGSAMSSAPMLNAGPPAGRVLWFVSSAAGQQQRMDTEGVTAAIAEGTVTRDNWVWKKGMAEWLRAGDCPDFVAFFTTQDTLQPPSLAEEPQPTMAGRVLELARPAVVTGSHVAGTASVHKGSGHNTDQRAIAMPIIRPGEGADGKTAEPIRRDNAPRRPTGPQRSSERSPLTRRETRNEGGLLRTHVPDRDATTAAYDVIEEDGGDEDTSKGKWSPATDTWTGPKARLTRKVDDRDRNAAVEWAETIGRRDAEQEQLRAQVTAWQRLAVAAVTALGIVLLVALLMTWKWREADSNLERLENATKLTTSHLGTK